MKKVTIKSKEQFKNENKHVSEIDKAYDDYVKSISVKNIGFEPEPINPTYYDLKLVSRKTGQSIECDVIDIAKAMGLSNCQFLALRYFRKKGGIDKQINDIDKAIESLKSYKQQLKTNI